jgi:hypothetical protein
MESAELVELLTHLRNSGRASAYDAIAAFAAALRALPPDFATQLQREADARVASGGALGALPKRELRGTDARDVDHDNVVLVLDDGPNSTCTATLRSDLLRFATGSAGKPFLDNVTLEDTIVLDSTRFAAQSVRDLGIAASITIVSTAKRANGKDFDERHDGTISTELKLTWNARGDRLTPPLPLLDDPHVAVPPAAHAVAPVDPFVAPGVVAPEAAATNDAIALGTSANRETVAPGFTNHETVAPGFANHETVEPIALSTEEREALTEPEPPVELPP